jgi:hypothetical protein
MKPTDNEECPACSGKGWLVDFNIDDDALELQRCDTCERFASDDDAQRHVATSKTCIVLALHELCTGLLAEAEHTLLSTPLNTITKNTLAAFRRSLCNTTTLGRKATNEDYGKR